MIWDPQNTLYRMIQRDCIVFGCLEGVFQFIWVIFWDARAAWGCSRVFLETHSMRASLRLEPTHHFGPTLKRQEFFHIPFLRHQNIKTSLYAISKNVWVLPFFLIFMPVREKLQFTVSFDHPALRPGKSFWLFCHYISLKTTTLLQSQFGWCKVLLRIRKNCP